MQILINESLSNHTNYKIGGNTPKMYIVSELTDFKDIPDNDLYNAYILGGGTNILVSDSGISQPVIKADFKQFLLDPISGILTIGSGYTLNQAAKELVLPGFLGLSHLSGIPGKIGGAITMNASASHGAISDYLIDVEAYNKETRERKVFTKSECRFGFRTSIFKDSKWIITFVRFQLKKANPEELEDLYNQIYEFRQKNYPLIFPSAGCCFRRDWGGKDIVKQIGMSGAIRGKAVVSPMFPAFILNTGGATAKDVYYLISEIQQKAMNIHEEMPLEIIIWGKIK
jgi:UDP-N-acetylmuramate dehydrogenase